MAADGSVTTIAQADAASRSRDTWSRIVLVGLLVLVAGFTAALISNALYPCVPAAESTVQPPLAECAVSLSPWLGLAVVGLALAAVGYLRLR